MHLFLDNYFDPEGVESIVNSRLATPGSPPLSSKLGEGDDRSRSELVDGDGERELVAG
jgi:hypothetical protein